MCVFTLQMRKRQREGIENASDNSTKPEETDTDESEASNTSCACLLYTSDAADE